ncbi:MAG: hypothetical protein VX447_14790, partial [Pseudomonadota bacterium]|nr:hypothetical protein [Pseudomonadota bacterium]
HRQSRSSTKPFIIKWIREKQRKQKTRYRPWNQVIQSPFIVLSDYPSLVACCAKTSFLRSLAKNGSQDRFLTRSLQLARPVLLGLSCPRPAGRRHCLPTFKSFPEGFVA